MNVFQQILSLLILFGVFNGLFLAGLFVLLKKGRRSANLLLAAILVIISLHLAEILLAITGLDWYIPRLGGSTWPLIFLIGPLYYLYVREFLVEPTRFRWHTVLHLIPSGYILYQVWGWLWLDSTVKSQWMKANPPWDSPQISTTLALIILFQALQLGVYAALAVRLLGNRAAELRNNTADTATESALRWMRILSSGFSVYCVLYFLMLLALLKFGAYGVEIDRAWLVMLSLVVHAIGYIVFQQPESFTARLAAAVKPGDPEELTATPAVAENTSAEPGEKGSRGKYSKASLSAAQISEFTRSLEKAIHQDLLHLREDLRLAELAAHCGISPHQLSQLLNQELGKNFFDYINGHRVREFCDRLPLPDYAGWSLLALAGECGFRNKGTFNRVFRQETGMTPGEWRRRNVDHRS